MPVTNPFAVPEPPPPLLVMTVPEPPVPAATSKSIAGAPEPPDPVLPKMKSRYPEKPYNMFGDEPNVMPSMMIEGTQVPLPPPPPKKQKTQLVAPKKALMQSKPKDAHGAFHPVVTSEMMMTPQDRRLIEAAEEDRKVVSPSSSQSDSISGNRCYARFVTVRA